MTKIKEFIGLLIALTILNVLMQCGLFLISEDKSTTVISLIIWEIVSVIVALNLISAEK